MHSVHIYNCRSQSPAVCEGNVAVVRSEDGTRFGVAIWKELRAIVDVNTGETTRDPKGISDENWLRGFPHHMAKDEKGCPRAFIEC